MTEPILPINPVIENLAEDKLQTFQQTVSKIDGILFLTFGDPGFDTPKVIQDATIQAIQNNRSHYCDSQGEPALRQAILDYMEDRYDLIYPGIDNVVVTAGATEAMQAAFKTVLKDGDGLLVPEPAYGSYFASITVAGGIAVPIDTAKNDFKLTPDLVDEAVKNADVPVKAILFNYPNNPTGVTYDRQELEALVESFKKNKLWVISDEVYSEFTYGKKHVSVGQLIPEQAIVINAISKSHAMTGYRLGFVLGPKAVMDYIQQVHGPLSYSVPTFIGDGAITALKMPKEDLSYMEEAYLKRRDFAQEKLEELGFDIVKPEGAFYLFAKIPSDFGEDGWTFAEKLANEAKVAVVPGAAFSHFEDANAYIRLSYASSQDQLAEGLSRIKGYVEKVRSNR